MTSLITDLLIVVNPEFLDTVGLFEHIANGLTRIFVDQVMRNKEPLKPWKCLDDIKDMVDSAASDAVVFQAEGHKPVFVTQHLGEVEHHIVVEIIVVEEDLLQALIFRKRSGEALQAEVPDQVAFQSKPCEAHEARQAHLSELSCTALADDVVGQTECLELRLVGQSLRQDLGAFSVDLIRVKTQIDEFIFLC